MVNQWLVDQFNVNLKEIFSFLVFFEKKTYLIWKKGEFRNEILII